MSEDEEWRLRLLDGGRTLDHADSGTVKLKRRGSKRLRENVRQLITGRDRNHFQMFGVDLSTDEMVLDLDVLGAIVEFRVVHHPDGAVIVAMKWSRAGLTAPKLECELTKPDVITASISGGIVFRFSGGLSNRLLETGFPRYGAPVQKIESASRRSACVWAASEVGISIANHDVDGVTGRETQTVMKSSA